MPRWEIWPGWKATRRPRRSDGLLYAFPVLRFHGSRFLTVPIIEDRLDLVGRMVVQKLSTSLKTWLYEFSIMSGGRVLDERVGQSVSTRMAGVFAVWVVGCPDQQTELCLEKSLTSHMAKTCYIRPVQVCHVLARFKVMSYSRCQTRLTAGFRIIERDLAIKARRRPCSLPHQIQITRISLKFRKHNCTGFVLEIISPGL